MTSVVTAATLQTTDAQVLAAEEDLYLLLRSSLLEHHAVLQHMQGFQSLALRHVDYETQQVQIPQADRP